MTKDIEDELMGIATGQSVSTVNAMLECGLSTSEILESIAQLKPVMREILNLSNKPDHGTNALMLLSIIVKNLLLTELEVAKIAERVTNETQKTKTDNVRPMGASESGSSGTRND